MRLLSISRRREQIALIAGTALKSSFGVECDDHQSVLAASISITAKLAFNSTLMQNVARKGDAFFDESRQ